MIIDKFFKQKQHSVEKKDEEKESFSVRFVLAVYFVLENLATFVIKDTLNKIKKIDFDLELEDLFRKSSKNEKLEKTFITFFSAFVFAVAIVIASIVFGFVGYLLLETLLELIKSVGH
jgi:NADH:ubiquinone oxidoreductase subunit 5 (subunit L)/multisubunit Na+/H+ antiporter MnhA subunit